MGNERGRFEAWVKAQGSTIDRFGFDVHIQKALQGRYKDRFADHAWDAWQAALARPCDDIEQLPKKLMRAEELQRIATRLANQCFVRYWLHWNHPYEPHNMAIECRDRWMEPMQISDMEKYGFEWDEIDRRYYIERDLVADGLKSP